MSLSVCFRGEWSLSVWGGGRVCYTGGSATLVVLLDSLKLAKFFALFFFFFLDFPFFLSQLISGHPL